MAERFAAIHEDLVGRLRGISGERWLDIGTGTGGIAIRAARAGADVTGLDVSETRLEQARSKARQAGISARFVDGDAQALPYSDAHFDVVSSCFGVIFAPDHRRAAGELARVCRPGGRLGLTAWRALAALTRLYEPFVDEPPLADADAWGDETHVEELLGRAFELEFDTGTWVLESDSLDAHYRLWSSAAPPMVAFLRRLDPARREDFREHYLRIAEAYVMPDGSVREEREYLLILGKRR